MYPLRLYRFRVKNLPENACGRPNRVFLTPHLTEEEASRRYIVLERLEHDCIVVTGAGPFTSELNRRCSLQDDDVPDFLWICSAKNCAKRCQNGRALTVVHLASRLLIVGLILIS